jgi:hypothetical protein
MLAWLISPANRSFGRRLRGIEHAGMRENRQIRMDETDRSGAQFGRADSTTTGEYQIYNSEKL